MKIVIKLSGIIALIVVIGLSLCSCKQPTDPPVKSVPVSGVSLNKTTLSMIIGENETLNVTVQPENATNKNVSWTSSNATVATVDSAGKVTAKAAGTTTIIVTTVDGGKLVTCNVTVTVPTQNPVVSDFDIGNLTQTAGSVTAVTITPKAGKSNGAIIVYYNGSTTLPTAVGTYAVTFNVAAATGFNPVSGLAGGTLTINARDLNPSARDFDVGNLTQTVGNVTAVTITPVAGKSSGEITVFYNGSTTLPTAIGTYTVTFNVAAAAGFYAASGLFGGYLTINQDPVASDFNIGNLTQTAGSVTEVTITPKAGKSTGEITVFYNGSTTLPTAAGTYTVTFDVAAVTDWNEASGLFGGYLTLNQDPVASDFNIGNLTQTAGNVTAVTITPQAGRSSGAITIYYNDSTMLPTAVGTYTVTFDVAASTGFNAASGLSAGTLTITATSIAINFDGPSEDIEMNKTSTASSVTFTVTNAVAYSGFQWLLDGVVRNEAAGNGSFTLNRIDAGTGPRRITVIAYKDGKAYSHELQFRFSE